MALVDGYMVKGDYKPYCTAAQLGLFNKAREAGSISFFRAANCSQCGTDVPKSKTFCSKECWEKSKETT